MPATAVAAAGAPAVGANPATQAKSSTPVTLLPRSAKAASNVPAAAVAGVPVGAVPTPPVKADAGPGKPEVPPPPPPLVDGPRAGTIETALEDDKTVPVVKTDIR